METTAQGVEVVEANVPKVRRGRRILARLAAGTVVLLAVAYLVISGVVADRVTKPRRKPLGALPSAIGLTYEDVEFNSTVDSIPLRGWFMDSPGDRAILMMHGRNGARGDESIGMLGLAKELVGQHYDVLTFDMRAHGLSGGERYSLGEWEVRDVAGAVNYLKGRGNTELGAVAYSMGAAALLRSAPDHQELKALVSDSSFSDLTKLLDAELPKASGLPSFFNPGILGMVGVLYGADVPGNKPVLSVARLGERPMLFIHSEIDRTVPVSHLSDLQQAATGNPNVQAWVAPGEGHVQGYKNNTAEYTRRVTEFFARYLK